MKEDRLFTKIANLLRPEVPKESKESGSSSKGGGGGVSAYVPDYVPQTILSLLVFILGATMKGDWVLFLAYYRKYQEKNHHAAAVESHLASSATALYNSSLPQLSSSSSLHSQNDTNATEGVLLAEDEDVMTSSAADLAWNELTLAFLDERFAGFVSILVPALTIAYLFFFGIGGFLHFYYYVCQRANAKDWKCQPDHWLTPELELHEIVVGAFSLTIGTVYSALMACWVINDGWSTVYFDPKEYGYLWLVLQVPIIFVYQDYLTYWAHRILHWPWMYKKFHKLHHTYKQPTAFSSTAIHPVEFMSIQTIYISPMFLFPVHFAPYCMILMYIYYHGILDHSGITFKRQFWQPWQPDCIFHDNHHQYFHVNFSFNIEYWDKLHGTDRQKGCIYREDIFYGKGKKLAEANEEEIAQDMAERQAENPLAYASNKRDFDLTQQELKKLK